MALAAVLLLTACHRGQKQQPNVTVGDSVICDSVADTVVPDVPLVLKADSIPAADKVLVAKRDSAEATHLRVFARKQKTLYSPTLMVGEWLRGSEHERYSGDGSGTHWDTSDDVHSSEAKDFRWTMDSNLLMFKYSIALGGIMVRQYVVTYVDDETLVYRDAYGDSYMWEKVTQTTLLP